VPESFRGGCSFGVGITDLSRNSFIKLSAPDERRRDSFKYTEIQIAMDAEISKRGLYTEDDAAGFELPFV
jgi:hypothetical protein